MAYTDPFLRLQVSGSLFTAESFSWSISMISDFPGPGDTPTTIPAGLVTAIQSFHTSTSMPHAKLETIKLNLIGADGKYVSDTTVFHDFATPVAGTATGNTYPPQIALAITLRTAKKRGLAASGRFFLPGPGRVLQADGRLSIADATAYATAATTLLNALTTNLPGWDPGVVSKVGAGAENPVTHVEVGRVYDTIRSRRTSLPEEYVIGAALAPDA